MNHFPKRTIELFMQLHFKKIGEEGKPLIILHGLFGMGDNWITIGKVLSIHYQFFILDLRNHGQSPHSEHFSYKIMASDVADFIAENNLEGAFLIGHSMGGKVLMQLAIDFPAIYEKLIIVDIAPKFYPVHHTAILQGLHSIDLKTLQSRTEANEILKRFESSEGVRQFLLKNLFRNPETGHFGWRFNLPILTNEIASIGDEITSNHAINKPILFIAGGQSSYILDSDHPSILSLFPLAKFEKIVEAGHWVQAEKPTEFVELVNHFLK